ncbi:hypothetical protein C2845_PM16G00300 [Panicum miliaceum]|uniref:Uncharacterized protein n=1 Tax=Panicum miliaceum TaxID=4540 RepID=A0A3L6PZS3_PANMI|nr:hypothetical protein C2845_PM16G00300 [Panicum miliaceum]
MAPPSLIQRASPTLAIHPGSEEQLAQIHAVALGNCTTVGGAQLSTAGGAPTSSSRVSLAPVLPLTTTPTVAIAPAGNTDVTGPIDGVEYVDPLDHTMTLTTPATVPPGALQTPDAAQLIYPGFVAEWR